MARVLRMKDLKEKVGLSESKIFDMMSRGDFPKSFRITTQCTGWLESTVDDWIMKKAEEGQRP